MNYLPITIIAYFLNSIAVTVDKFLLTKAIPDPLIYIFYFSLVSLLAVFAIPFVPMPTFEILTLASLSAVFWTLAAYFMFKALKSGQVQRVIPVIGTITSLILLFFAAQSQSISLSQAMAITILVLGLIFLTIHDWKGKLAKMEIGLEAGSALFFALSYYLLRLAFERQGFLTVLVWSRPVLFPLLLIFLIIPKLRRKILPFLHPKIDVTNKNSLLFIFRRKTVLWFIFGQISAGISELLLVFSISLTSPAIVNSLQGIKYIFLLIFSLILGRRFPIIFQNNFSKKLLIGQSAGIAFIAIGLYLLAFSS